MIEPWGSIKSTPCGAVLQIGFVSLAQAFAAQNPDCLRLRRSTQISLIWRSSRTTKYAIPSKYRHLIAAQYLSLRA
jgi:hypothetical protein